MTDPFTAEDAAWLAHALALAEAQVGRTAPNPAVGAACVRAGRLLGAGAHLKAGGPHAEVNCLAACTEDPAGATLYVTLEPCSTTGRTPPCCDLIRAKRLGRVVIGCLDPNPRHAGRAIALLREAGIAVTLAEGDVAARCRALIAPFAKAIAQGLPYVRLKQAMTLDGFIADGSGERRAVTGPEAYAWTQRLRARVDAVMVGMGTVRVDRPSLQPHLPGVPPKWRVLVDRATPPAPGDVDAHTLVASRDLGYDGRDLRPMLRALCARGVNDVLCEGGGRLAGALLDEGLVDELHLLYAPTILGDRTAVPGLAIAPRTLLVPLRLVPVAREALGADTLLTFRPAPAT